MGDVLKVTRVMGRGGCRVILEGSIDERTNLRRQLEDLTGVVVIDLDKVTRITSFGVLEWRAALSALRASYYTFIRCRSHLVTQFNIVDGFGERGELTSLYLPYVCSSCSNEFELLVDLRHHYFVAVSREPPHAVCRKCGAEAVFDALPDDFFSYVGSRPRPHVPPDALRLIDGVIGDVVESLKVRKEIDGVVTSLKMTGPLTGGARLKAATEGIDGFLVVDVGDVTALDTAGVAALGDAIRRLRLRASCCARLPMHLLPAYAEGARALPGTTLASALIDEQCPACDATSSFEVGRRELTASELKVACPSCRAAIPLRLGATALRALCDNVVEQPDEIAAVLRGRQVAAAPAVQPAPPLRATDGITLVGESGAFRDILDSLRRVAPTSATVLLRGETGTGKEMLARLIHRESQRRDGPFVAVNCAALPENLIESELFGHERGSFTGATHQNMGRFERASGGTLFIDEIGDIPLTVQVKLLRALQERTIERVGSGEAIPVDIRLVAATHRSLEQMMANGQFREDLFFRVSVVPIFVPPLRQRPADIWPIALHYFGEAQRRSGRTGIRFSQRMRQALESHSWPGNVRELINVVERAVAMTPSNGTVEAIDVENHARWLSTPTPTPWISTPTPTPTPAPAPPPVHASSAPAAAASGSLKGSLDDYERRLIAEALERADGNRTHAARALGISRQALLLKIAKYGL